MTKLIARFAFALVLALGGIGQALADNINLADQGAAYAKCQASGAKTQKNFTCAHNAGSPKGYMCQVEGYGCDYYAGRFMNPSPKEVYNGHYYPDAANCNYRQPMYSGGLYDATFAGGNICANGCEYRLDQSTRISLDTPSKNSIIAGKGMHVPTGNVCKPPETPEKKPPQGKVCQETLGGHVFCTKDNGEICVTSAKTGRTYCGSSTTGTNATNPERTENVTIGPPSPTPTPPAPPTPRPGEDWKPTGSGIVNNITNNNSNSVTMNSNAGTPNTNPGAGNPNDGSGNPGLPGTGGTDGGSGDGEGLKPNSVGGGGACGSAYTCTGGDQALCAILREQHQARCNTEKGPGEGDLSGAEGGMGEGIGKLFGGDGPSTNVLDVLGNYIGSQPGCPSNPQVDAGAWGSLELPLDKICPHLKLLGTLLLGFAYLLAVKIMLE